MRTNVNRVLTRLQTSFGDFTSGQKVVAVIGTAALLLAGFALFRWASAPSYAPLYGDLASKDAAGVIEQLDSRGVPYKLEGGGGTIMVPRDEVYGLRIAMSAEGLPTSSAGGYSLLDDQGLSTSQFQEQTDYKRAMEGELANTIEAIDGVEQAVVHLALPPRQIFADEQDPATASVLVQTRTGQTLAAEQVQAVVNLVASSIDGLDPGKVTVADSTGKVLSAADGSEASMASSHTQQVDDFQSQMGARLQQMLDRVLGPGHSQVQVTADLSFDKSVTETTRYFANPGVPPLSSNEISEKYVGAGAGGGASGVLGPDGQMEPGASAGSGNSRYDKKSKTSDNPVSVSHERREAAPGSVNSIHIGVVMDELGPVQANPDDVRALVEAAVGVDAERGDTVEVAAMPFDRTVEEAAAKELEVAAKADAKEEQMGLYRNIGLGVLALLIAFVAWLRGKKKAKQRAEATTYVVEQLRRDAVERQASQAALEPSPALAALEAAETDVTAELRDEIAALVERQPEDVAALLRGWLVERA